MNLFQKFMIKYFPADTLRNFQWYRKHCGGYWVHSKALGWYKYENRWFIAATEEFFKTNPEAYSFGKEIEDYR
jgi:hypothetical protein